MGEKNPHYGKTPWNKGKSIFSDEDKKKLSEIHRKTAPRGIHHSNSRPVLQFSRDGTFIREWDCIQQAVDGVNVT